MGDLTAVILTKNEETYIRDCLNSLRWCDEVIVLDSLSIDRTVEIARQCGAEVVLRPFTSFADQRNAAIEMVTSKWILFVDADERISPQLAAEIAAAIDDPLYSGYWIPTHNYQMGRLILHAGLYPDCHLRLFRTGKGHYDLAQKVHEKASLDGEAGFLANPLVHISCETWADFINHQKHYAQLKAQMHFERGVKPSYHFVAGPVLEFLRRYVYLQGYRDGLHGLYLSFVFAYYYFVMFVILSRIWKAHPGGNRALSSIGQSLKLVAIVLLAGLLFLALSQRSDAQSAASCQQVVQYLDINGDGQPEAMVLACQFAPDTSDQLTIYKQPGKLLVNIPWQQNVTYENETWIFDHGTQGRASLIIKFRRDGTSLVAELYDDRNQDGKVDYATDNSKVNITEGQYWTVRVVTPDGWWIRDGGLNYNLHILVDGDVEGMFSMETYRHWLVTDGQPDYDILIYDQNQNGKPEFDKRMILTSWLQGSVGLGTQMMANWADDETPIRGGFSLWPYLDLAHKWRSGSRVGKVGAPIMFEPATGRIEAIGEFVASRLNEQNCFYYSGIRWQQGKVNESNNENPFCFYDLAEDGDGVPELQIRSVYWPPHDPAFLGGRVSEPYELIRYSWDQENTTTWRYAVGLAGRHLEDARVTFSDIDVLTVPYSELPGWVTGNSWDMAVFSEFTGKSYFTSEGNYSVSYLEDRKFAEYFTGLADRVPSPEYEPDVDFKMEWAMDYASQPYLYFSSVDRRLHLRAAQGGAWNLGEGRYIRYANLDGDAYLDQWQEERDGTVIQQLNTRAGTYVYSGNGGVQIKRTDVGLALFESQPPQNNEEWQRLGAQLKAHQAAFSPEDFPGMLGQFAGLETQIRGATLREYRATPQGFRFLLELQAGFSVPIDQENLAPLLGAPGSCVIEYDGKAWSVRPATPPSLRASDLRVNSQDGALRALGWITTEAIVHNDGTEDLHDLSICATFDGPPGRTTVMTVTLALLPGEGQQRVTWDWASPSPGIWTVGVLANCRGPDDTSAAQLLGQTSVTVSSVPSPSAGWLISVGGRVPGSIVLFLLATVVIAGATAVAWVKGSGV